VDGRQIEERTIAYVEVRESEAVEGRGNSFRQSRGIPLLQDGQGYCMLYTNFVSMVEDSHGSCFHAVDDLELSRTLMQHLHGRNGGYWLPLAVKT
jgi:hypothetical protein